MEVFGKKLTEARVARGLDFDQVSRETNITRRYLEALEKEDFTVFPGEPYLLGFLRNYCEYLGLNSNEIISAYKNLKIQETPVPLKDLMPRRPITDRIFSGPNSSRLLIGFAGVALLAVLIGLGVFIGGNLSNREPVQVTVSETRKASAYEVTGETFKQRLYAGDSVSVTTASGVYKMTVSSTAPAVTLDTPVGNRVVELGQDLLIDLSGDNQPDVKVFVADLFKNDPSKGADVQLSTAVDGVSIAGTAASVSATAAPTDVIVPVTGAVSPAGNAKQTVLFEGGSAYPVSMNATFRGYCLFRYETDKSNREERYYQKSELLTVQANNGIRIWASNGNSVKLQLIAGGKTVDLEVSRPGEVLVRDLKWLKDEETGRYKFVVMDID
jgi:cytoskeletal protein RodZ